ncbi:hypothetical protein [Nonomuraea sp. NPDC049607]|uniref:hypothetical protein n=1 Tax=unclassified Nonomuraea TaxID=2593643 RepID=UPI0034351136
MLPTGQYYGNSTLRRIARGDPGQPLSMRTLTAGRAVPFAARTRRRGVRGLLLPAMAGPLTRPTGRRGGTSRGGDVS